MIKPPNKNFFKEKTFRKIDGFNQFNAHISFKKHSRYLNKYFIHFTRILLRVVPPFDKFQLTFLLSCSLKLFYSFIYPIGSLVYLKMEQPALCVVYIVYILYLYLRKIWISLPYICLLIYTPFLHGILTPTSNVYLQYILGIRSEVKMFCSETLVSELRASAPSKRINIRCTINTDKAVARVKCR